MALVAAISLLMGIVQATAAWSEQGPTEAVKGTVSELLSILKELKDPTRSEARRWADLPPINQVESGVRIPADGREGAWHGNGIP